MADHTGQFWHHPLASSAVIVKKTVGHHLFLNIIPTISQLEPNEKFGVIGASSHRNIRFGARAKPSQP